MTSGAPYNITPPSPPQKRNISKRRGGFNFCLSIFVLQSFCACAYASNQSTSPTAVASPCGGCLRYFVNGTALSLSVTNSCNKHTRPPPLQQQNHQSNECLLLDVTIMEDGRERLTGEDWVFGTIGDPTGPTVKLLEQVLPIAVERGRRTYSHKSDCSYISSGGWCRSGGSGSADFVQSPLCRCGAGKVCEWVVEYDGVISGS